VNVHSNSKRNKGSDERIRSEERFREIAERSFDTIYMIDREGLLTYVSPAVEKSMGYSPGELVGRNFLVFLPKSYARQSKQVMKCLREGTPVDVTLAEVIRKNGSLAQVEFNIFPIVKAGEFQGAQGTIRDITQRKQNEEKLLRYQEQLRSLTLELILTEERERRKIAVNLHDHIGQQLALAKMKLETLHSGKVHSGQDREVKEISRILGETIRGTRSLIFELSPPILYELGFEAAVEWLAESIHDQFHFQIDVESDNRGEPLNDVMQVMLFQIVRELLLNTAKHSRARRAKIGIKRSHRHIRILVEDDGIGFDGDEYFSRKNAPGFGFFSIRERLNSLGGDLRVESEAGKGTSVYLRVPLPSGAGIRREKKNGN
jgi:PAS domain S-box-containing protein